jgi:membrane protease YdiL (CAAX protease family)
VRRLRAGPELPAASPRALDRGGRPELRLWLALAAALALGGNLVARIGLRRHGDPEAEFRRINPGLTALLGLWLLAARPLSRQEIGWRWPGLRHALLGLLAGLLMGLPPALVFCFPIGVRRGPIRWRTVEALSARAFTAKLLVDLPIVTVLWEELAFRGVLEGGLRRHLRARDAVLISATAFSAGHVVLNRAALAATNLEGSWVPTPLAVAGCLLSVGAGGLIFSGLRLVSGSLVPPMLAHWGVDAAMLATLYLLGRRASRRGLE